MLNLETFMVVALKHETQTHTLYNYTHKHDQLSFLVDMYVPIITVG